MQIPIEVFVALIDLKVNIVGTIRAVNNPSLPLGIRVFIVLNLLIYFYFAVVGISKMVIMQFVSGAYVLFTSIAMVVLLMNLWTFEKKSRMMFVVGSIISFLILSIFTQFDIIVPLSTAYQLWFLQIRSRTKTLFSQ